jgi:hypothetical protein
MNIENVELENLLLDHENPRLPRSVEREQQEMLVYIAENYSIEELMTSIGENGFFPGEPIIALRGQEKHIVVEGNRRLAAVKLLAAPQLVNIPSITRISNEAKQPDPVTLPVVVFDARNEVMNYLGHRHITGVKPWSSFAKARYLGALYEEALRDGASPLDAVLAVTRIVGSRRDYVERILGTLFVCEEVERQNYFDLDGVGENNLPFSVFYTAFQRAAIRQYVNYFNLYEVHNNQINIEHLKNLTKWICVSIDGSTILKNPGNLERLATILEHDSAREELERGATIDQASAYTGTQTQEFGEELHLVRRTLASLNSRVAEIDFDDELDGQIGLIVDQVKNLRSSWNSKTSGDDL